MTDLPSPLMTSEPGSFARATIVTRKPKIIQQVIETNAYPPEIVQALNAFSAEIAGSPMQPLKEGVGEADFWAHAFAPYAGRTWVEIPWFFAETFFYRRLLEAVRYFQPGPWQGHDPFQVQKQRQLEADLNGFSSEWDYIKGLEPAAAAKVLLHSGLWGNRADLSNSSARDKAPGGMDTSAEEQNIVIEDTGRAIQFISRGLARLDLVTDNAGRELLFDLALAGFLVDQGWVNTVIFHLKNQPYFVSDAMLADVSSALDGLQKTSNTLGSHLSNLIAAGQVRLTDHPFWTTCLMDRDFPPDLWEDLASSNLVVLKGDVNYRRILDDRHWPHDTRMEDAARYFPSSFLTLRTLKSEIMVGLQPGQAEKLHAEDPTWLINGKRGLIQLIIK